MRLWRCRLAAIVICVVAGGAAFSARAYLLPPVARWLDVGVEPPRVDYVMVLPGDENTRPFVAAAIVNVGLADKVIVPETERGPAVDDGILPENDEIIRRVLRCRGVSEAKVLVLPGKSNSTHADAKLLATFLDRAPNARVAVVTNDYHTRRARWVFSRVLGDQAERISFVSAPTDDFQAGNWWQSEKGFTAISGEYAKLAYYTLRYGRLRYYAAAGAVLVVVLTIARRRGTPTT